MLACQVEHYAPDEQDSRLLAFAVKPATDSVKPRERMRSGEIEPKTPAAADCMIILATTAQKHPAYDNVSFSDLMHLCRKRTRQQPVSSEREAFLCDVIVSSSCSLSVTCETDVLWDNLGVEEDVTSGDKDRDEAPHGGNPSGWAGQLGRAVK